MSAEIALLFPGQDQTFGDTSALRFKEATRIVEALLFAAPEPIAEAEVARRLPEGVAIEAVMARLRADYEGRGIRLVRVGAKWTFRTAEDLGWLLSSSGREMLKLSRAAMETLAIIAYHQPATRAEIEDIRGVSAAKGTLDVLLSTGWIRLRGRRRSPGRPITYGTTDAFLLHFGLEAIADLPGLDELRGAGFFENMSPDGFIVPLPRDGPLYPDEEPLDDEAAADTDSCDEEADELHQDLDEPDSLDRDPFA